MKDKNLVATFAKFLMFALVFAPALVNATIFYVTPSGAGLMNGSTWANATPGNYLQAIIDVAAPGDEVWVACGTYYPTAGVDRSISFAMKNGVAVYGSFQGNETQLSQRVFSCGPCSILSGEIGQAGIFDNSYKIVYNELLDSTAVMDGFLVRDGNDDRSPTNNGNGLGGGIYNHGFGSGASCNPILRNCVMFNNRASWGGGAFNNGYAGGSAEPVYENCIFYNNHAYIEAGGMDSYGVGGNASPKLFNCLFYGNTSATNVGAMYAWGGNAGGNCNPLLTNCVFVNNAALNGYCGAFIADNLDENGTTSSGTCTVTLVNCIVWNNTATGAGPQFYVNGNGAQVIANYSAIDTTGQTAPHIISGPGNNNLFNDPLFANIFDATGPDSCWMSADDGLQLQSGSPCIDAGWNPGTSYFDLAGNPRINNGTVDLGAYEVQQSVSVSSSAPTNHLNLYPNPAADFIYLNAPGVFPDEIFIVTAMGQWQQAATYPEAQTEPGKFKLNLQHLSPGIYFIIAGNSSGAFQKH